MTVDPEHPERSGKTGAEIAATKQACPFPEVEIELARVAKPFRTDRGDLAEHGQAPSAEEIDANRSEICGESLS